MADQQKAKGRWKLFAVLGVCAFPLIASYVTYYIIKPTGRTNYGTILDPRDYPIPPLGATTLDGKATGLEAYKGKWIMLRAGPADCAKECHDQLFAMRQLRLMQGKEMERLERVWLVTDKAPLETMLIREFDGMHMLRADGGVVAQWLPLEGQEPVSSHIYLIDPLGNLMMRFPVNPDPNKVKKDIGKLLKASGIG